MERAAYDLIATEWDGARRTFFGRERAHLDTLLEGLPPGARVLDLGCGTGRPMAEYILACGHAVTGVDASRALLDRARERFPQATWVEGRIEDYASAETFDAVVCWDALFHLPRELHAGVLAKIADALRPGGRFAFTTGGSAHPPFTDVMFGREFFYDSLPPDDLRTLVQRSGFTILVDEFMNVPDGGRDKGRIALVAAKPRPEPKIHRH